MFRGFADPSRLAILDLLRAGPKCVYEIADSANLSQPNTSSHLACLEECGLVQRERRGKFIYYRMAHKEATALLNQAEAILAKVGDHIFHCARYEGKNRKRKKLRT
jgi:DNA-binding transcriptional ArsR family regulator